ncbi:hypothetical protein HPB47_014007 [Ixodes persulcatus]|uniref:Uncharacterized protein n=1 Tax=Ixodes persulcatus TaxID=34615 RepID=A0AC60R2V2_IXOPE|nr:hypothetical protein HPB47_014007 [Ixodes persulcatus]
MFERNIQPSDDKRSSSTAWGSKDSASTTPYQLLSERRKKRQPQEMVSNETVRALEAEVSQPINARASRDVCLHLGEPHKPDECKLLVEVQNSSVAAAQQDGIKTWSQQFCLKWNNHQSNVLVVFEQLISYEVLVNVTLACEGHSLKAHRMVLSACSPFFQALFVENPCKHPIVIINDMRYMNLKAIVEFMYKGEVNVSQDQLSALLKTEEALEVKGLAEVTGDNRHGLVSVDGADSRTISTARAESPTMSKRKRGRPRRRSRSDSNKSDSEDQGAPPATRIKTPESPEVIEDGSLSSDHVTAVAAESPAAARTSSGAVLTVMSSSSATVVSSNKVVEGLRASALAANNSMSLHHTIDSVGDDTGADGDDVDIEPSNLKEQSMTTDNAPVTATFVWEYSTLAHCWEPDLHLEA